MIEWAAAEFRRWRLLGGATEAEHSQARRRIEMRVGGARSAASARQSGTPLRKSGDVFPYDLVHVWSMFCEIVRGVPANGMVPPAISWTDLQAWGGLVGETLKPWEARLLIELGNVRASVLAEEQKAKS